jgi:actin-related protein 2
MQGNT